MNEADITIQQQQQQQQAWDRIGQGFRDYLDLLGVTPEMYNRENFDRGSYFNNYVQFQQQQQQQADGKKNFGFGSFFLVEFITLTNTPVPSPEMVF